MIGKEQQIKNSFIYFMSVIAITAMPFITLPIFTRILSREDYGVLALSQIYAIFLTGLLNFGMKNAYNRNFFQYRDDRQKTAELLYSILLFVLTNFFLFGVLTFLFQKPIASFITHSADNGNIIFWSYCAHFFGSVNYYYLIYFRNSEAAKSYTAYTIASSLINLVVSIFLVAVFRIGIIGIVYAQLCSGLIIFFLLSNKFRIMHPPAVNGKVFIETLKISYPMAPRVFLGVINTQFDKYMISLLANIGGVGLYNIGQRASNVIFVFMGAIQNVFSPQVYKMMFDMRENGGKKIGKYLTPFCYISILVALIIALFAQEFIVVLTPKQYHGAINVVTILSMVYGLCFFGKQPQLMFAKKTGIISLVMLLRIVVNIGINIPFIARWGIYGAAWATFLAEVISGGISFMVSQHYYKIEWEYKKIGTIFLIFFVSSILIVFMRHFLVSYMLRVIFKLGVVSGYVYVGVRLRVITRENYNMVKKIVFTFRNNLEKCSPSGA